MNDAEFIKQMFKLMETVGEMKIDMAVHAEKQSSDMAALTIKVDELKEDVSDVKDDVSNVKNQIEDLSKRLAVLENKKSVFSGIKEFISNGFGFFSKYYKFVLAAIVIFVVLFGSSLGLDVGAIVPVMMGLFGL